MKITFNRFYLPYSKYATFGVNRTRYTYVERKLILVYTVYIMFYIVEYFIPDWFPVAQANKPHIRGAFSKL